MTEPKLPQKACAENAARLPVRPVIDVCVLDATPMPVNRPEPLKRRFDWVSVVECGREGDPLAMNYYGVPGLAFLPSSCGSVGCETCGPRVRERGLSPADGLVLLPGRYGFMVTITSRFRVTRRDSATDEEVAHACFVAGLDVDSLTLEERAGLVGYSREEFITSVRNLRSSLSRRDRRVVWWGGWDVFEAEPRPEEQSEEPCPARFWPGDLYPYTDARPPVEGRENPELAAFLGSIGFALPGPRDAQRVVEEVPVMGPHRRLVRPERQDGLTTWPAVWGGLEWGGWPCEEQVRWASFPAPARYPPGHILDANQQVRPLPSHMPAFVKAKAQKHRDMTDFPASAELFRACVAGEGCPMCGGTGKLAATHLHAHLLVLAEPFWAGVNTPKSEEARLRGLIFGGYELTPPEAKLYRQAKLAQKYDWSLMPGGVGLKTYAQNRGLGHTDVVRLKSHDLARRYLSKVAKSYLSKVADLDKPYEDWPADFGGAEGGRRARFMHAGAWLTGVRSVQPWGGCLGLSSRSRDPGVDVRPVGVLPSDEAEFVSARYRERLYWAYRKDAGHDLARRASGFSDEDELTIGRYAGRVVTREAGKEALAVQGVPRLRVHRGGDRRAAALPFEGGLSPFALSNRTNSPHGGEGGEQPPCSGDQPLVSSPTTAPAVEYAATICQPGIRDACEPYLIQHDGWRIWMCGDRVADMSRGHGVVPWLKVAEVAAERVWSMSRSGALEVLQRKRYGLSPSDDAADVDWLPGDSLTHVGGVPLVLWMWRNVLRQLDALGAPPTFSWCLWREVTFDGMPGPPTDFQAMWNFYQATVRGKSAQSSDSENASVIALD